MNKEKYEPAELEIIAFYTEDVIETSPPTHVDPEDDEIPKM